MKIILRNTGQESHFLRPYSNCHVKCQTDFPVKTKMNKTIFLRKYNKQFFLAKIKKKDSYFIITAVTFIFIFGHIF